VIHFVRNVSGGLTLQERVSEQGAKILKICNGFSVKDGSPRPEKMNKQASAALSATLGPLPEQTPVVIKKSAGSTFHARTPLVDPPGLPPLWWMAIDPDPSGLFDFGLVTSGALNFNLETPADAVPIQFKTKAIIPTVGAYPALWVVEGASGAYDRRLLGVKSPGEYDSSAKPVVSMCAEADNWRKEGFWQPKPLFDCPTGGAPWTAAEAWASVDVSVAGKSVLTVSDAAETNHKAFTKALGTSVATITLGSAGGVGYAPGDIIEITDGGFGCMVEVLTANDVYPWEVLSVGATPIRGGTGYATGDNQATTAVTGRGSGCTIDIDSKDGVNLSPGSRERPAVYMILDLMITGDPQIYPDAGLFSNNPGLYPSGYIIALYKNADCATDLIKQFHIPQLLPLDTVQRVAINIGEYAVGTEVKGIAIWTADFFVPPPTGKTYSLTLFSAAFKEDWTHVGNFIAPATVWDKAPLAEKLLEGLAAGATGKTELPEADSLITNGDFEVDSGWTKGGAGHGDAYYRISKRGKHCMGLSHVGAYIEQVDIPLDVARREYMLSLWVRSNLGCTGAWNVTITPDAGDPIVFPDTGAISVMMDDSDNNCVAVGHGFVNGDAFTFGKTVGGVTAGQTYYVAGTITADSFQFSTSSTGTPVFAVTADVANTVTGWYSIASGTEYTRHVMQFTAPVGSTKCTIRITGNTQLVDIFDWPAIQIDDVSLVYSNIVETYATWILQQFNQQGGDRTPESDQVQYCFAFCVKDKVAADGEEFKWIISNPSDPSTAAVADPWRIPRLAWDIDLGGMQPSLSGDVLIAGTGYEIGDSIILDGGDGNCEMVVTKLDGSGVGEVLVVHSGSGYLNVSYDTTTDGGGSGCYICPHLYNPAYDYYDHLKCVLLYRRFYDGAAGIWSDWTFFRAIDYTTETMDDDGNDADAILETLPIPLILEERNDFPSSAKLVMAAASEDRIYAGCLSWDNTAEIWRRPLAIEVMSAGKEAFPTTADANSPRDDGVELIVPSVTGYELRAMLATPDDKFVWTDSEFFMLRGDNPIDGWQFKMLASKGAISSRCVGYCSTAGIVIWSDGQEFIAYTPGGDIPIGRTQVDATLVDWESPHNAFTIGDEYILWCKYAGEWSLVVFDAVAGAWRVRSSANLEGVGACTDGTSAFLLLSDGTIIDLRGADDADYPAETADRQVTTQPLVVALPGHEVAIAEMLLEASCDEDMTVTMIAETEGNPNSGYMQDVNLKANRTSYAFPCNLRGAAVGVGVQYEGGRGLVIHGMGVRTEETA